MRTVKIGVSYAKSLLHQIKPETTLEQFLINRFGRELYLTFFKSYTEKGVGRSLRSDQRRMGRAAHQRPVDHESDRSFPEEALRVRSQPGDIAQKGTETSLIEKFMYPKLGPGQLWEYVAEDVKSKGGGCEDRLEGG